MIYYMNYSMCVCVCLCARVCVYNIYIYMKSSFAKKITPFLTIFKKHVFYCAFQLISIKLQLGKVDKVQNNKKIQLTNSETK